MTSYNPYPGSYNPLPGISGMPMAPLTMPDAQPSIQPASVYSQTADSLDLRHRRMHKDKKLPWYASFGKEVAKAALTVGASMAGFAVGGVPGAMLAGTGSAAALSALDQHWTRGKVLWGSVAIDGALGMLPGFVGKHVAVQGGHLLSKFTGKSVDVMKINPLKQAAIIGATDGAVLGYVGSAATCAYDTYQKTGQVEWQHALVEGAKGSVSGLLGGAIAGGGFTALGGRMSKAKGISSDGSTHPKPDSSAGQAVAKPSESASSVDAASSTQNTTNWVATKPAQAESRLTAPESPVLPVVPKPVVKVEPIVPQTSPKLSIASPETRMNNESLPPVNKTDAPVPPVQKKPASILNQEEKSVPLQNSQSIGAPMEPTVLPKKLPLPTHLNLDKWVARLPETEERKNNLKKILNYIFSHEDPETTWFAYMRPNTNKNPLLRANGGNGEASLGGDPLFIKYTKQSLDHYYKDSVAFKKANSQYTYGCYGNTYGPDGVLLKIPQVPLKLTEVEQHQANTLLKEFFNTSDPYESYSHWSTTTSAAADEERRVNRRVGRRMARYDENRSLTLSDLMIRDT